MRGRHQSLLPELLHPEISAIEEVVERYQRVAPAVTRFARSLADNDSLRVVLGTESAASDDEIICDPRLFQAAAGREAPVTPDEVAIASALHEVMHLVGTRLDEVRPIPADWPVEGERPDEPVDLLEAVNRAGGPIAEFLFFALEDARQERQGLRAYPGARSVLADIYNASFADAVRQGGSLGQFALACFMLCGGYAERERLEKRIHAAAAVALDDATGIVEEASEATDPWKVATLSLALAEIARLNHLIPPPGTELTPAQTRKYEAHQAEQASGAVDRMRLPSPIVRDTRGYQETRRASHSKAGVTGQKGDSEIAADPTTDQLLRVSEAPTIYLPTGQTGKLIVGPAPLSFSKFASEGREAMAKATAAWSISQRHVSGELFPLFAANQRRGLRTDFDQGDISPHAALFIGAGLYTRMYERRAVRTRRNYAVSLLVDASASMLQERPGLHGLRSSWSMPAAILGSWRLAKLCDELQIDFEIALFNRSFAARAGDTELSYSRTKGQAISGLKRTQGSNAERLTTTVNHYLVKPFDRRWRDAEDVLAGIFYTASSPSCASITAKRSPHDSPPVSMFEKAANVDEYNLVHAAERMRRFGANHRVLVVLADGMTRGSIEALASTVKTLEHSGTTVLGIGIGDDSVTHTYSQHQIVHSPDSLAQAMVEGVRSTLKKSLIQWGMDTWWSRPTRIPRKDPLSA